jgi:hypothetical protein
MDELKTIKQILKEKPQSEDSESLKELDPKKIEAEVRASLPPIIRNPRNKPKPDQT